jgi:two-component system, NtrC family, response regulator AtoC
LRSVFSAALELAGFVVHVASDGASAMRAAESQLPEIVLLDLRLPDAHGFDLIPRLRELDELVGIVVLTAVQEVSVVVRAMQLGADDFLVKPSDLDDLVETLSRHLERRRAERRHRADRARSPRSQGLVGGSAQMERVRQLIGQVADTDATVLLEGESGTGKGLAAEEIHSLSGRAAGPFLDLNCAGLSPALLESELFGHEQGAFTDASRAKPGLLEIAAGGTVFLDEIGDMPLEVQSRLLKVLEGRRFRRVGGLRDLTANVRLVTASNRDLRAMVRDGDFRQDLFYRLHVFAITIPPLRERREDILPLAHHFLNELNQVMGTSVEGVEASATEFLLGYPWPGNARELRNVVERAVILAREGRIGAHHLPSDLSSSRYRAASGNGEALKALSEMESDHIERVLEATGGNIKRAAEILGVSRTTLYNKIRTYDLVVPP